MKSYDKLVPPVLYNDPNNPNVYGMNFEDTNCLHDAINFYWILVSVSDPAIVRFRVTVLAIDSINEASMVHWCNMRTNERTSNDFSSISDRLTQPIFSFRKNGRIIVYVFRATWHTAIVCSMLNGWRKSGDRIHSSRMLNRFNFKLWPFQIITCGCIAIKPYRTWWNWLCSWLVQWILPFIRMTRKNVKCKSKAVSYQPMSESTHTADFMILFTLCSIAHHWWIAVRMGYP